MKAWYNHIATETLAENAAVYELRGSGFSNSFSALKFLQIFRAMENSEVWFVEFYTILQKANVEVHPMKCIHPR